jgi:aspartyl-tRNA(Asn)/glutamyl-tRNA(Gln) amidotransferase subunit A
MIVALENSIMIKNAGCTANSKVLNGFVAPFSSVVYEKLTKAEAITSAWQIETLTEFGTFPFFEKPNADGVIEALHSGSFDAVLINDYCGTAKFLAAKNNLIYFQPSYNAVSRFGLVNTASSMDNIGVLARTVDDAKKVFSAIGSEVAEIKNPTVETVGCENFELAKEAFLIVSSAEIYANLSRYDGVKFGLRGEGKSLEDMYINTRSAGFGLNAKLQLVLGSMVLSANYYASLYDKAMRLRRVIKDKLCGFLKTSDAILIPFDAKNEYCYEDLSVTALPALSGLPALTFAKNNQSYLAIAKTESGLFGAKEVCHE